MTKPQPVVVYEQSMRSVQRTGIVLLVLAFLVAVPAAMFVENTACLFVPVVVLILIGLFMVLMRQRITVDVEARTVRVSSVMLGLSLGRRDYSPESCRGFVIQRKSRPKQNVTEWLLELWVAGRIFPVKLCMTREDARQLRKNLGGDMWLHRDEWTAEDMLASAQQALESAPDSPEGWYQLGQARQRAGDLAGAREAFQKALELTAEPLMARSIKYRLDRLGQAQTDPAGISA